MRTRSRGPSLRGEAASLLLPVAALLGVAAAGAAAYYVLAAIEDAAAPDGAVATSVGGEDDLAPAPVRVVALRADGIGGTYGALTMTVHLAPDEDAFSLDRLVIHADLADERFTLYPGAVRTFEVAFSDGLPREANVLRPGETATVRVPAPAPFAAGSAFRVTLEVPGAQSVLVEGAAPKPIDAVAGATAIPLRLPSA